MILMISLSLIIEVVPEVEKEVVTVVKLGGQFSVICMHHVIYTLMCLFFRWSIRSEW